jgi:putative glutathione S-transferase
MPAQFASETSESGEFQRQEDTFREWVSNDGSTPRPVAVGRYHLYVSLACPWASRTVIFRKLKGLDDAIGMTVVDPFRDEKGWAFRDPERVRPGTQLKKLDEFESTDPINGFRYLSEAYQATDPNFKGRVTVPMLWDKITKKMVNNCEDDICPMFNRVFDAFAKNKDVDLFPKDIEAEHTKLCDFIYDNINNGVYKAGFATRQRPYEISCQKLFDALDEIEKRLTNGRYLFGNRMVEADWRLFCTLIRFDVVYHGHFKCNLRRIIDYPNLQGYLLDLYQLPGIAETVSIDHIKRHYYMTHEEINPTRIVPLGPIVRLGESVQWRIDLTRAHGRERFSGPR